MKKELWSAVASEALHRFDIADGTGRRAKAPPPLRPVGALHRVIVMRHALASGNEPAQFDVAVADDGFIGVAEGAETDHAIFIETQIF
jgi:hypothetical protein